MDPYISASPVEEVELQQVTQNTAGMTLYGNRARTSVMLPLNWLELLQKEAKERGSTVNQVIVEMLIQLHSTDSEEH